MFTKGDTVELTREALDRLYPAGGGYQNRASRKRWIVIGYSRDKKCTRLRPVGGSPNSSVTYHNSFLEKVS